MARGKFFLVSVEYIPVNTLWHVQPMSDYELLHLTVRTISAAASKHRQQRGNGIYLRVNELESNWPTSTEGLDIGRRSDKS